MLQNFLSQCTIKVKKPSDCSEAEINSFYDEVLKGSKVAADGLKERIKNCELLAFCNRDNKLIGISSVKRPNPDYVAQVIKKAKIDRQVEELTFEIGYSFTDEAYRKNGISGMLKTQLLEKMRGKKGIIFSTTAIASSQHFFEQNGFQKKGQPYVGHNDTGITYYEKVLG